ncbi:hypothetical protein [Rossellomorea marisflavi]|uniref:hypothetical protein n=1 Tax=Rossellomorea TaxID=2837508 RepID=UPI00064ECC3E|nr:hypothetical protein [Rossellomorea marisflavi]KMK94750.1 hypothetical protein VL03_08010 [Rossellomorea marisflavi]KML07746.1 hypothetical protein VL06_04055 [Rossellomorea marisflavi]KML33796.1 hypothetical protein VL12_09135 [Rossellomorea marisflavi]MCM2605726.1 hypothetical protein [Rossellomorea marisflavi]QHA35536.1 hypothetical protein D5E69_06655 [Rossellomorea marisflavi]
MKRKAAWFSILLAMILTLGGCSSLQTAISGDKEEKKEKTEQTGEEKTAKKDDSDQSGEANAEESTDATATEEEGTASGDGGTASIDDIPADGSVQDDSLSTEEDPFNDDSSDAFDSPAAGDAETTMPGQGPSIEASEEEFAAFDKEIQLALFQARMMEVMLYYDYGIGNPDFYIKENMTEEDVQMVKSELQTIQIEEPVYKSMHDEALGLLDSIDNSKEVDGDIKKYKETQDKYLAISEEMIKTIEKVNVDNAAETRKKLDDMTTEYLRISTELGVIMKDIVVKQGLDHAYFVEALDGIMTSAGMDGVI